MRQTAAIFLLFLLLLRCGQEKSTPPFNRQVTLPDSSTASLAKFDKEILLFGENRDSLSTYIHLNKQVFDSVKKWKGESAGIFYLDNIIAREEEIKKDTSLVKDLETALFWRGFVYPAEEYNDSAVACFEKMIVLTRFQNKAAGLIPYACNRLGIQYAILGDVKKSVYYNLLQSESGLESGNNELYVSGIINAAVSLNETGLYDSTITLIRKALTYPVQPKRTAQLHANLAEALAGKHLYKESLAEATESIKIMSGLDLDSDLELLQSSLLKNKGEIELEAGNPGAASVSFEKAWNILITVNQHDRHNRESGKLSIARGRVLEALGNTGAALSAYQFALSCVTQADSIRVDSWPTPADIQAENTIMEALDAKSDLLLKLFKEQNKPDLLKQAVTGYELAFETEKKLISGFSYNESILRQLKESRRRSKKSIEACYALYNQQTDSVWAEKAMLFAEKSKAIVLKTSIRRNLAASQGVATDSNWINAEKLRREISYYETALMQHASADSSIQFKKKTAEKKLLVAETALYRENDAYRKWMLNEDTLSISRIRSGLLDAKTGLFEYFESDSCSYLFGITATGTPVFRKITAATGSFLRFFINKDAILNNPAGYREEASSLFSQTGWSVFSEAGISKVILIPDGQWNFVPFDALVSNKSGSGLNNLHYLLYDFSLTYGYSAATLLTQKAFTNSESNEQVSVFAPLFTNRERGMTPLLFSAAELEAVQQAKPGGKYYQGKEASLARFRERISQPGIIHIASHASADTSAGTVPVIEFYDSSLYLNEIYTLQCKPELVVLSACETGLGVMQQSEGPMSLARGFSYAGARNIITSIWSADDQRSAQLFSLFYKNLQGNDYVSALRLSKTEYLKTAGSAGASPYYWAGFIHIGNLEKTAAPVHFPYFILIAILAGVILVFFFIRKSR